MVPDHLEILRKDHHEAFPVPACRLVTKKREILWREKAMIEKEVCHMDIRLTSLSSCAG